MLKRLYAYLRYRYIHGQVQVTNLQVYCLLL